MATTPGAAGAAAELLGGRRVLHRRIVNPRQMLDAVRLGLPYSAFEAFVERLGLPAKLLSALIGLPPRTLARRRASNHLSAGESDRLYRVARIAGLAQEALGGLDKAREWLRRPNRSLGGSVPLAMLDTEIGARLVEQALLRLEHGVYA